MSERTYKPSDPFLAQRAEQQASAPCSRLVSRAGVLSPSSGLSGAATTSGAGGIGGAAGAASSSLEESTLKDQSDFSEGPGYRCTLKDFGDGKVVCVGVYLEKGWGGRKVSSEGAPFVVVRELPEYFIAERSEFSRRRAKKTVREKIWMLRADRMLTLTKRGKFETMDEAWAAWKSFCKLARKFWGSRWQFVVVPEAHKEGGYHLHVALCGYFDVGMVRRLWSRALGGNGRESGTDTLGNVDITPAVSSPRSRTRIANYLAKYLGKNVGTVFCHRRSVASSRGIPAPRVVRWNQAVRSGSSAIGVAQRKVAELVDARLEGLGWWEFSCGGFHGFVISPLD